MSVFELNLVGNLASFFVLLLSYLLSFTFACLFLNCTYQHENDALTRLFSFFCMKDVFCIREEKRREKQADLSIQNERFAVRLAARFFLAGAVGVTFGRGVMN